jgi:hypothetical protein
VKRLCQLLAGLAVAGALGCGNGEPNKNLKPVDPNAPRPEVGKEGPSQVPADKPAPVIK